MPSAKDPASTVQPGPGTPPRGSVTATALNFSPSLHSAPISAHINDPFEAHKASAISAGPYGGSSVWAAPAASVDTTFTEVFAGLNSRALLVLDANSLALNADYAGPNALIDAFAAAPGAAYYLRPGQYNWGDAAILSNVMIFGAGSPTTNAGTTQVEIRNTAGNIRFANGSTLKNVLVTVSGVVQLPAGTGGCLFENVHFKVTGNSVQVQSSNNLLRQCSTHTSSTAATFVRDSGGANSYDTLRVEQLEVTTVGGCSFSNVKVGSAIAPSAPGTPLVNLTAGHNVFNQLTIAHAGGSMTANSLAVLSTGNVLNRVRIDNTSTSVETVLFATGTNTVVNNLLVLGCTGCSGQTSSGLVRFSTTDTVVSNLRIVTCTAAGSNNAAVAFSDSYNTIENLTATGITAAAVLRYSGTGNKVIGANIATTAGGGTAIVDFSGTAYASSFRAGRVGGFAVTVTAAVFRIGGDNNSVEGVELDSLTTLSVPLLHFLGRGSKASGLKCSGLSVTAGAGFSVVRFTSATACAVAGLSVWTSPNFGTTSGLLLFQASTRCVVDGFILNGVGSGGTFINSPLLTANTGVNRRCVVRDVAAVDSIFATGLVLLDVDSAFWEGLLLERVECVDFIGTGSVLRLRSTLPASRQFLPVRIVDSVFDSGSGTAGAAVQVTGFGARALFQGCTIAGNGTHAVQIDTSWGIEFSECVLNGRGVATVVCSSIASGVKFSRTSFIGPNGTPGNGTQVFCGYGAVGSSTIPASPLVLEDCTMELGSRNIVSGSLTRPLVFFGGSGTTVATSHGATVVRGLRIVKEPTATISQWHAHSTLAIDVLEQSTSVQSYFENIVVDLGNAVFTTDGANGNSTQPLGPFFASIGSVVEIRGPSEAVHGSDTRTKSTVVKGLSLLNFPRQGSTSTGSRCALAASGVTFENLSVDGAVGAALGTWGIGVVFLASCKLSDADFYATTGLYVGSTGSVLVLLDSHADNVRMRNFLITASGQQYCVNCVDGSSLSRSTIQMAFGAHIPTAGAVIIADEDCVVAENQITIDHQATSSTDHRRGISVGDGCRVVNNVLVNTANPSSASYPTRGGGCGLLVTGDFNVVSGNEVRYSWASDTSRVWGIEVRGSSNKIVENVVRNQCGTTFASGGTAYVGIVSGTTRLYNYFAANHLVTAHTSDAGAVIHTTDGGKSIIIGNFIDNTTATAGAIVQETVVDADIVQSNFLT